MSAITLQQIEVEPASLPAVPSGLSSGAADLLDVAWRRVECYISWRYSAREVTWVVEAPGEWVPPLQPAEVMNIEVWSAGEWTESGAVFAGPTAYFLPMTGPWRITAEVGGGSPAPVVPVAVAEAVRRLAEYMAADAGKPGVSSESASVGALTFSIRRDAAWQAKALQYSGAADLLRPYRRAP